MPRFAGVCNEPSDAVRSGPSLNPTRLGLSHWAPPFNQTSTVWLAMPLPSWSTTRPASRPVPGSVMVRTSGSELWPGRSARKNSCAPMESAVTRAATAWSRAAR